LTPETLIAFDGENGSFDGEKIGDIVNPEVGKKEIVRRRRDDAINDLETRIARD
jgi:hypothetical protein